MKLDDRRLARLDIVSKISAKTDNVVNTADQLSRHWIDILKWGINVAISGFGAWNLFVALLLGADGDAQQQRKIAYGVEKHDADNHPEPVFNVSFAALRRAAEITIGSELDVGDKAIFSALGFKAAAVTSVGSDQPNRSTNPAPAEK